MTKTQEVLFELLSFNKVSAAIPDSLTKSIPEKLQNFSPEEIADIYVTAALLISTLQFLKEEHWLQSQKSPHLKLVFSIFVEPLFKAELQPFQFLRSFLQKSSLAELKEISREAQTIEKACLEFIKTRPFLEQRIFITGALEKMSLLFEFEARLQQEKKASGLSLGLSLYRTFDRLDDIFNLNYKADLGMKTDLLGKERLYEGAGVGVQSGYSTVLTALRHLQPAQGARFIDLGSGYGRVGLVVGLLRPDIDFTGYEFVQHRVDIASATTDNLGMNHHVHFYTQDLSQKDFQIPEADIYYLYDPFSEETYGHVLSQLVQISQRQSITIATKGNAKTWLADLARREGWAAPEEFDSGNLCLFRS